MADALVAGGDVVKRYGPYAAVDGVSFSILRGECFGFLGPNGAGKTTLLKMIQCLAPLTSGRVTVDGMEAGQDDRKIKSIIGVAPQEDSLDPDLTVFQNLVIYAGYFDIPRRQAERKADELLKFFHLEEKRAEKIRVLSGGMRRRLVIARALVNDPKLLILDEPTTGLDPQARIVIWRKIENLKAEGVTMILTTHYMEEARRLCDRLAIMNMGKIMATGAPDALMRDHLGETVVEARPRPGMEDKLEPSLKRLGAAFVRAGDVYLVFKTAPGAIPAELAEASLISTRPASMEDLFMKIAGRHPGGM
ncbi:MAG: ABC transporter ATP-binding protein [Nitrospinae bacterium]|nr:ABC transporter ATP-binding protein [Nitrospinota bacterium]